MKSKGFEGPLAVLSGARGEAAAKLLGEVLTALQSESAMMKGKVSGATLTVRGPKKAGWLLGAKVHLRRSGELEVFSLTTPDARIAASVAFNSTSGAWESNPVECGASAPTARGHVVDAIRRVIAASRRLPVDRIWVSVNSELSLHPKSPFRKCHTPSEDSGAG